MILQNLVFFIYKLSYFFIPIPLFFDFGAMDIVLMNADQYNFRERPGIPFPIGGIFFAFMIFCGFLLYVTRSNRISLALKPASLLIFLFFYFSILGVHAFFVAELGVFRFIQLVLPAVFVSFLAYPVLQKDRVQVLTYYLIGLSLFIFGHTLSLVLLSDNFLNLNDRSEFSSFFGYLVYQALVSYPGVLSINLLLVLALLYRQFGADKIYPKPVNFVLFGLVICLVYLGMASGRKAFLLEFSSVVFITFLLSFFYVIIKFKVNVKAFVALSVFLVFSSFAIIAFLVTDLSYRFFKSIEKNALDSGRVDILFDSFHFFSNNLKVFFLGAGGAGEPGMHNFVLDQVYRVGILAVVFSYLSFSYLLKRFYIKNNNYLSKGYAKGVFFLAACSSLFWQSMINSSITQPYYLVNILVVFSFILFPVFSTKEFKYK